MNRSATVRAGVWRSIRGVTAAVVVAALAAAAGCSDSTGPGDDGGGGGSGVLQLEVGESQVIQGGDGQTVRFGLPGPGASGAQYRLAVESAARSQGATPMRLSVSGGSGSSSVTTTRAGSGGEWAMRGGSVDPDGLAARTRLQERTRRALARRGVRPARPVGGETVDRTVRASHTQVASAGDTVKLRFAVSRQNGSLTFSCDLTQSEEVVAVVRAVGQRAAMVEDTATSDLGSASMDYQALAQEFDDLVFGVNVAYFGSPTDIDGNGHVLVLFSPKVNDLSDPTSEAKVAGFFLPPDLADNGDAEGDGTSAGGTVCPAGNEAELLYVLAPDPEGAHNAGQITAEQAQRNARSTASHEFQHLQNAGNRLIKQAGTFGDLEDTWLGEGLSHVAEEIVGLAREQETLRSNLSAADVRETTSEQQTFETFHANNFERLSRYLEDPAGTLALGTADGNDPGGVESLKMRGFAWLFTRWLGDQAVGTSGGQVPGTGDPEENLYRQLAKAGGQNLATGTQNIELVTGRDWRDLIAEFGPVPAVDDDVASLASQHELLTWNLREIYQSYPLAFTSGGFAAATYDFSVEAATQRYVYLETDGSAQEITLELTDQSGEPLAAGSPQITVVRTR